MSKYRPNDPVGPRRRLFYEIHAFFEIIVHQGFCSPTEVLNPDISPFFPQIRTFFLQD